MTISASGSPGFESSTRDSEPMFEFQISRQVSLFAPFLPGQVLMPLVRLLHQAPSIEIIQPYIQRRNNMNFLQKLLQGIAFVPAVVNGIEGLFGNRSGTEKKESAISFVGAALQLTEAVSNREIVDEAKFKLGLSKVIDGTVDCLNASSWARAKQL
jgi:hypothetical protein